jgi:hypothetical protein
VQRREDEHYPPAVDATGAEASCRDAGIPDLPENYDRCVGPAQILPLLNDAFAGGMTGTDPELNAARIEAALLWFLYTSVFKEATTCADAPADCDSSYAYYTGAAGDVPRDAGIGMSRYVRAADVGADEATWDAELANRCWRDLLDAGSIGDGVEHHDRSMAQLDRALDRDLAVIVSARTIQMDAAASVWVAAHWEAIRILGRALGRAATAVDATLAGDLADALDVEDPAAADTAAIRELLEQLFPCP